jgi:hypothetical protein
MSTHALEAPGFSPAKQAAVAGGFSHGEHWPPGLKANF